MGALMTCLFVHTNRLLINELEVSLGQLIHDTESSIELSKKRQKYPKKLIKNYNVKNFIRQGRLLGV